MARKPTWSILIVVVGVATGMALSLKPWQHYREQKEIANNARAEMKATEQQRSELMREKSRLESPVGREELARERGYRRPWEKPIPDSR